MMGQHIESRELDRLFVRNPEPDGLSDALAISASDGGQLASSSVDRVHVQPAGHGGSTGLRVRITRGLWIEFEWHGW